MKSKLLFLHHKYGILSPHQPVGGAASCTIEMAEWLQEQGCEVTIAAILPEKSDYRHRGVKYIHLGEEYDLERHLPILGKKGFDGVSVIRGESLSKVAAYMPGAARVLRLVDVFFQSHEITPAEINRFADRVVAVSSYVRDSASHWGIRAENIQVVPVGIRTDIFRPRPEVERRRNLVVFAGATLPEKGIHLLLQSFVMAFPSGLNDVSLEIYGSAGLWNRHEEIPWQKVTERFPNIRYMGARKKLELAEALNRASVCVIPSLVPEGFTRISIEAQACGCPVLCSASGGLPETLRHGETGFIMERNEPQYLADLMQRFLLDGAQLRAMSLSAAEHGRLFPVEKAARRLLAQFEDASRHRYCP